MTKIARFRTKDGSTHYGQIGTDDVLHVMEGDPFDGWQPTDEVLSLSDVKLMAPVDPPNIFAIGLNYRAHAEESGAPIPERPIVFIKATTAVCGPEDNIVLPHMAPNEVDYECELAVVMGKEARNVSKDEALSYVLGYTCGHDVSARDCQLRLDAQWARGKSFDTFCPLGPWIETDINPDEADISTRLNGRIMQSSNTSDLIFSCAKLISYISHCMTLRPGTVIMTGTPGGVGAARKPPVFLRPGDEVEIAVSGIGVLRNPVVADAYCVGPQ